MNHFAQDNRGNNTTASSNPKAAPFDSGAHWHTEVPAAPAPVNSFAAKTWTKVLSVCLSLLLALTMFDATALTSYASELSDAATPMADMPESESGDSAGEKGDSAETSLWTASAQSQSLPKEALTALLPQGRVSAAEVLPAVTTATVAAEDREAIVDADIASRVTPSVRAWGSPFNVETGFFVKGAPVHAEYDLGNLADSLEGGYVAGSQKGDRFALTLEVPFLYVNDEGTLGKTFSEEEWRLRTALADQVAAAKNGQGVASYDEALSRAREAAKAKGATEKAMRAAIFAEKVPEGWSLWQEHDGSYVRMTDADLAAGVSGRLVFIYEANGGKLSADATAPRFDMGFVGDVPSDETVAVHYGYEAHSFTARANKKGETPAAEYGDVKRASLGAYGLVNDAKKIRAELSAEVYGKPEMEISQDGSSLGYLSLLARLQMKGTEARAWAVALLLMPIGRVRAV